MTRIRTVVRIDYTTRKYTIDQSDITGGLFERLINKRDRKVRTVKGVLKELRDGESFDAPLVVNQVEGKYQLIDGNNRMEAIELYISDEPTTNKVEVTLHIYQNKTFEECKDLFTKWNKGVKQSTDDVVKQYEKDIPLFDLLKADFPIAVSAYGGSGISFYKLVSIYMASQKPKFQGGHSSDPWKFVEDAKELTGVDYELMKAYVKDWISAFGPWKNNKWAKGTPFTAIMRIWMDNRTDIPRDKMLNMFRKKLMNDYKAIELIKISGKTACMHVRNQYVELLNVGRARDIFVIRDN